MTTSEENFVINRSSVRLNNPNWECIYAQCVAGRHKGVPVCDTQSRYCTVSRKNPKTPPDLRKGDYIGEKPPAASLNFKKKILRAIHETKCSEIMKIASDIRWDNLLARIKNELNIHRVLRETMISELRFLGGNLGAEMARRFFSGNSEPWIHGTDSKLGKMVKKSGVFIAAQEGIRAQLKGQFKNAFKLPGPNDSGGIILDWEKMNQIDIAIDDSAFPWIEWPLGYAVEQKLSGENMAEAKALIAVIGGAKGNKFFIRNLASDPLIKGYKFDLRIEICDHFGVDQSDLYSPGLCAFWMLQHAIPGLQSPFVNVIRIDQKGLTVGNIIQ